MGIKRTAEKGSSYSRVFEGMRGVDFSGDVSPDDGKYAYLENMYVDYDGSGELESIPGFRKLYSFYRKIYGIFSQKLTGEEYILVHADKNLYRFNAADRDSLSALKPICQSMARERSSSITFGDILYIFDGEKIVSVSKDGTAKTAISLYTPTITLNGEKYEGRNLMTPNFRAKYLLYDPEEYSFGTPGLEYKIISYDERTCELVGIGTAADTSIYVPRYAEISGNKYRVKSVANLAFSGNTAIKEFITNSGLEDIGYRAFYNCSSLSSVSLAKTVKTIGVRCFENCSALSKLYVGAEFSSFGEHSFDLCTSLHEIDYALGEEELSRISGTQHYEDRFVNLNSTYRRIRLMLPYPPNFKLITRVQISGRNTSFSLDTSGIIINETDRDLIDGQELVIYGQLTSEGDGFLATAAGALLSPDKAITGCRLALSLDGRMLLTANPSLPGVIFYSREGVGGGDTPLYFSTDDFIIDGDGDSYITSLIPNKDGFAAVLSDVGGGGGIYVHRGEGEGNSRKYPVSYTVGSVPKTGDAIFFMGEMLFVSSRGLTAGITDTDGRLMGLSSRSGAVSRLLAAEDSENIRLTEWCGYLVMSSGGHLYLADSRSKYKSGDDYNYDWYYINGVGGFQNSYTVFRYHTLPKEGYILSDKSDCIVESDKEIFSEGEELESMVFYIESPEGRIRVYPTDEWTGSDFRPATELLSSGDLLFFGTDDGKLFVFNNDKRGAAPPELEASADFDREEYLGSMGKRIHPFYYSFDKIKVKYTVVTPADSGGFPDLEKSTAGNPAIRFSNLSCAEISVSVNDIDGGISELCRIHSGYLDFSRIDFSEFSFCTSEYSTVAISEHKRGFTEKQYVISAYGANTPIGINSIAYRYKIKGRIRNK